MNNTLISFPSSRFGVYALVHSNIPPKKDANWRCGSEDNVIFPKVLLETAGLGKNTPFKWTQSVCYCVCHCVCHRPRCCMPPPVFQGSPRCSPCPPSSLEWTPQCLGSPTSKLWTFTCGSALSLCFCPWSSTQLSTTCLQCKNVKRGNCERRYEFSVQANIRCQSIPLHWMHS